MNKKFFAVAAPSVVSMWFYSFYTMADGYFVARGVGPMALASVNIAMPYINFIFCLSILCSAGASSIISKYLGSGDAEKARTAFMTNLAFLLSISLLVSSFSLTFTDELAVFLGATPGLARGVADYLRVISCFAPFFMVTYFFEMMSRADGRPRLAAVSVVLAGITNITLDYVFVLKFGCGIKGAAWATGIAQVLPAVTLFACFRFRSRHIAFAKFKFGAAHVLRGLKLGVGDSVTELSVGAAIFLFNRRIQEIIGENGVAGYTVIAYMTTLVVMTMFGVSQGMLPLSSYHHGRNDAETVARIRALAVKSAIVCGAAWFAVSEIFAPQIVSAFINPETERIIYADTVKAFRIFAVSFVFTGINIVLATFFSSVERPAYGIILSACRGLIVIAIALYAMSAVWGSLGIWLSPIVSEAACAVIGVGIVRAMNRKTAKTRAGDNAGD